MVEDRDRCRQRGVAQDLWMTLAAAPRKASGPHVKTCAGLVSRAQRPELERRGPDQVVDAGF